MVRLQEAQSANLELVKSQHLVAVFAGGTSGIGEYTLRALANAHANTGKGLRVYITGRNESAAQKIISDCQQACPSGSFTFIKANDLSLLKEVDVVCNKISEFERKETNPKIDILVMSHACPPWRSQENNAEGLDFFMSLLYYSRMRMATNLLPLLTASSLPAHVISVYAGGMEGKLLKDDLMLRKPGNYSLLQVRSHVSYMTTLYMEHLAKKYPNQLSLTHVFPSLVITPGFDDPEMPFWIKLIWKCGGGFLARLYALPVQESGQRTLFLASPRYPAYKENGDEQAQSNSPGNNVAVGTDGKYGSGAYAINWDGESVSVVKQYQKVDKAKLSELVLDHTHRAFEQIERGLVFKD